MENLSLLREIASRIARDSRTDVQTLKRRAAREFGLSDVPRNSAILGAASPEDLPLVRQRLLVKPTRTLSGVAPIAVMTSPAPCPHGRCLPCPGGPDHPFASPQSYTGQEPAARRAREYEYDPYRQVRGRLDHYVILGHHVSKAELIVMGGTITARDPEYQAWFVGRCLAAMNDHGAPIASVGADPMVEAQRNEDASVRCVAVTFETRPDCCTRSGIDRMLDLGVTKVELGVQHLSNDVLEFIRRGHSVEETVRANTELRDAGLKVGFHMMPNLPGSSLEQDREVYRELFEDPRFRPDFLKLYPTLVTPGTELEDLYHRGAYAPFDEEDLIDLIADIKADLPGYVRLQRIQRDIPAPLIVAGSRHGNFRQLAGDRLRETGRECCCIRCREVGRREKHSSLPEVSTLVYECCRGEERFIQATAGPSLIGFVRLRFPGSSWRHEIYGAALIRELHVYGAQVRLGDEARGGEWQHRNFGRVLLAEAERQAGEAGFGSIAVMSGVGVRPYYHRQGYKRNGPYMVKQIR
jgi:elongator complex protein 3